MIGKGKAWCVVLAAAFAACAGAGRAESAPAAGAKVTRVGAVNWDCSRPSRTFFGHYATRSLGPEKFRDRTPYYAKVVGKDRIDYADRTLAEYEQEMRYAIEAGLDYFAYCWYDQTPQPAPNPTAISATADPYVHEITRARLLHVKSALRDRLHLCAIVVACHVYSDRELTALAQEMREPWYEKVGGRPLVYFFCGLGPLARLREICRREGAADPYAVLQCNGGIPKGDYGDVQAFSAYAGCASARTWEEFFERGCLRSNQRRAAAGKPIIPHFGTGWDPTPRNEHPVPWASYSKDSPYAPPATREQWAEGARKLKAWIDSTAGQCTTGHVLAFAWNEFEEGGWICPTLGRDGRPDTSRCAAFADAVRILKE